ncbi:MAG: N-acetyltransferase [Acidobacteria bacterium]|nr:N-acetyltransferase [Acidobacteriota bacterium]
MTQSITSFETSRLRAVQVFDHHFDDLCSLWREEQVMAWSGGVQSSEQCRGMFRAAVEHWDQYGFGRWVWFEKDGGALVGLAGFRCMTVDDWPEVTLGYLLKPGYWGQGYATEIAGALVGLSFARLGMESIIALTAPGNAASRRVLEKVGMKYNREGMYENLPHVIYEITRAEWAAAHSTK